MKTTRINLELNTYLKAPPDPNPRYFEGRMHEGVARHFYPYPVDDNLTDNLSAKSYEAYQLENEYLRITIIPESAAASTPLSIRRTITSLCTVMWSSNLR